MKKKVVSVIGFSALLLSLFSGLSFSMVVKASLLESIKNVDYEESSTPVGGRISANTTWTFEDSPYIVTGDVIVEPNVCLTIEPGVVMKFINDTLVREDASFHKLSLIIDGALIAQGNSTHKIIFTSAASVPEIWDWGSIWVRDTGQLSNVSYWVVEYARIGLYYQGKQQYFEIQNSMFQWNVDGILCYNSKISIENTTFLNNGHRYEVPGGSGTGSYTIGAGNNAKIFVKNSLFSKNEGRQLFGSWGNAVIYLDNCTLSDNKHESYLFYGDGNDEISNSIIANNDAYSAIIRNIKNMYNTLVFNNTQHTWISGTIGGSPVLDIKDIWNCNITRNRTIKIEALNIRNCSFSYNLDKSRLISYGSMRNCDISYNTESARHIVAKASGDVVNCNITHNEGALWLYGGKIVDSLISHNTIGIIIGGSPAMHHQILRSIIKFNNYGIIVEKVIEGGVVSPGDIQVHFNNIHDNTVYNFRNNVDGDINATHNWWGTTNETLIEEHIYDYYDDYHLGRVFYKPFLAPPIANFTYWPETPYACGTVTFDASASFNPYGSITSYVWDFGNDTTTIVTSSIVTHTYTEPGNYNVTLTVTDEYGLMNNATTSLAVLPDNVSPVTVDDYDGLWHIADFTITLTATDHESGVAETYYRINDGSVQNVSAHGQPRITTESANNTLQYWSADNAGNEDLPHKILTGIKLDKTAPIANAGVDQTVNEDTLVTFDGSASTDENGVTSYIWTFTIEGIPKTETLVEHGFNQGGGWQHWGFNLEKEDIIHIYYETGSDLFGGPLFFLILDQSKYEEWPNGQWSPPEFSIAHGNNQIENWNWTVPKNGTWHFVFDFRQTFREDVYIKLTKYWDVTPKTLTGKNPTYTFATPGTYIVTLTVEDAAGNNATDKVTITVLLDTDGDGTPDITDTDDDNDGVPDIDDAFPLDPTESIDTDNDGVGNNADTDDDNDGMPDTWETENGLNPLDAADASLDPDKDGLTNLEEYQGGTNPNASDAEAVPLWILGAAAVVIIGIAVVTTFLWRRRKQP